MNNEFAIGLQSTRERVTSMYDANEGIAEMNDFRYKRQVVRRFHGPIVERLVMSTSERLVRIVLLSGFLAVLALEAWLLLRALTF